MSGNAPKEIMIGRMVHVDNVEYILDNGLCTTQHPGADPNYINIGDSSLIKQRTEVRVPIPPGGMLGEYIPFYFGGHSPMLLNIKTGYRGITKRPQEDIVFIACKVNDVVQHCPEWVFTDGHAKDKFTSFYNTIDVLADVIDWKMVMEQYWKNTEDDFDRQRRKQAEFLIKQHVPVSCIHRIIVKTQTRKDQIDALIAARSLNIPVKIDSKNQLYYS